MPAPRSSQIGAAEGDGWVNWSGLATHLAGIDEGFPGKLNRFFLTLRPHKPHEDRKRSTIEVELRAPLTSS